MKEDWKFGIKRSTPAVDIPDQLQDAELTDIESPQRNGSGIPVKFGQAGVMVEDDEGEFHGIFYAQFRGRVRLNKAQTLLRVPFEEEDGMYDLVVEGKELKSLARHLTLTQRVTLQAGGMVSSVRVEKREEPEGK